MSVKGSGYLLGEARVLVVDRGERGVFDVSQREREREVFDVSLSRCWMLPL